LLEGLLAGLLGLGGRLPLPLLDLGPLLGLARFLFGADPSLLLFADAALFLLLLAADLGLALGLAVGQRLDGAEHPVVDSGLNADAVLRVIAPARNDLEAPALTVAPVIGEALALLRAQAGCRLARMSGSGATVFAIFSDDGAAETAAGAISAAQPGWWVEPTRLA
ncbi:MAG: hypothetical protein MIN69_25000, partial [Methylorubrum extorquens]